MIIGTILLMVKLYAEDLASLCIKRGDLSWAMRIGLDFCNLSASVFIIASSTGQEVNLIQG